jgi:hypothetical protein
MRSPLTCLLFAGVFLSLPSRLDAVDVDSEIVLLVDVSVPGLSNTQFDALMSSYASAFTSSQVLDSIQSGSRGRIALSMMFFGNALTQSVGIPWMSIGSAADADLFADLVSNVSRPFSFGFAAPAQALAAATQHFGTETGGVDNGFESSVQIIEVAASGLAFPFNAAATSDASDAAFGSGVDLVNSTSLGIFGGISENYYEQNVIGSTIPGVEATSNTSATDETLAVSIVNGLDESIQAGAAVSVTAIPEPRTLLITLSSVGLVLLRRRRA